MALQPTALTLTPEWTEKRLAIVGGSPAVHEKVAVTLTGGATALGAVPGELVVRVHSPGNGVSGGLPSWHPLSDSTVTAAPVEFARFPLAAADAWAVATNGLDLTCTLELDTAALDAVFDGRAYDAVVDAVIVIESGSADNLYAVGRLRIRNWLINTDDPVLGSSVLKTRVDALETALAAEEATREEDDDGEALARANADSALGLRIDAAASNAGLLQEIADRTAAVQSEAATRQAADDDLTDALAAKATTAALSNEVIARQAAVANEALARSDADTALTLAMAAKATETALTAETNARGVAVAAEAQARTLADNALTDLIALKQAKPSAGALAAVAALEDVPAEYDESQVRAILNAALAALRGLYA